MSTTQPILVIETVNTPQIAADLSLLAQVGNVPDKFYDVAPYATSASFLSMDPDDVSEQDNVTEDLEKISFHIERRVRGVTCVTKENNALRVICLHPNYGVVMVIEPTGDADIHPRRYRVVGSKEAIGRLGTTIDKYVRFNFDGQE